MDVDADEVEGVEGEGVGEERKVGDALLRSRGRIEKMRDPEGAGAFALFPLLLSIYSPLLTLPCLPTHLLLILPCLPTHFYSLTMCTLLTFYSLTTCPLLARSAHLRSCLAARLIISRANAEDLILHYNTPAFLASNPDAFLGGHARGSGRIKKVLSSFLSFPFFPFFSFLFLSFPSIVMKRTNTDL